MRFVWIRSQENSAMLEDKIFMCYNCERNYTDQRVNKRNT